MFTHIAVLGAGTMGHSIALMFAGNGKKTVLYDPFHEVLERARRQIHDHAQLLLAEEWPYASSVQETDRYLKYTNDVREAVRGADLIIEAAPENLQLKRQLYRELESELSETAVVASNTSTFPLAVLAEGQSFADRMFIMHFFNPAHLVPLVEIVPPARGSESSAHLSARLSEQLVSLLTGCGKSPVVLGKDVPGFIANRLQAAVMREALYLLDSGVADAEEIDRAMTAGPGLRWSLSGPLEVADYGGLDVWAKVMERLLPELETGKDTPELLKKRVAAGHLGVKSGQGIYNYAAQTSAQSAIVRNKQIIRMLKTKMSVQQK